MEFIKKNITTIAVFVTIAIVAAMVFILENSGTDTVEKSNVAYEYTQVEETPEVTETVEEIQEEQLQETELPQETKQPQKTEQPQEKAIDEVEQEYIEPQTTELYVEETVTNTDAPTSTQANTCEISIYCNVLLDNMDKLSKNKRGLVPKDGCILKSETVEIEDGDTVFDVLKRVTREHKIHMEYVNTPVYNSAYIEGINNLYEFDGGELSGWMYCVNGEFPNYGCSGYSVKAGDVIEWHYSCDLGRDLNGGFVSQKED